MLDMTLFSSSQWEDVDEPLRKVTHPDTPKLFIVNAILFTAVAVASFVVPPSFLSGIIIAGLSFWLAMRNIIVNNTKLNPISSGKWKNLVNVSSVVVFVWVAFYLIACLATEVSVILAAVTPVSN